MDLYLDWAEIVVRWGTTLKNWSSKWRGKAFLLEENILDMMRMDAGRIGESIKLRKNCT